VLNKLIDLAFLGIGAYLAWQSQQHEKRVIEASEKIIEVNDRLHAYLLTERDSHRSERDSMIAIKDAYLHVLDNYTNTAAFIPELKRMDHIIEDRDDAEQRAQTFRSELYALQREYSDMQRQYVELLKSESGSLKDYLSRLVEMEETLDTEDEDLVDYDQVDEDDDGFEEEV